MRPTALAPPVALVALAAAGGVVLMLHQGHPSPAAAPADVRVEAGRVVHVDAAVWSTTFLPLGAAPRDGTTLSAQRAYNLLVSGSAKLQLIPATVQPFYGVLTDRGAASTSEGVRVWAFAADSGCSSRTHGRCRTWEFVDARTGRDVGVVTQEVLPD